MNRVLVVLMLVTLAILLTGTVLMIAAIDRPAPAPAGGPSREIHVKVRADDLAPIPHVPVALLVGEEIVARGRTDASGEAVFPAIGGPGASS